MSYCPHCGTQLGSGATFCTSCGAPLNNVSTARRIPDQNAGTSGNVFTDYFIGALKKYAIFEGRARRKEYWFFQLFSFLIGIGFLILDAVLGTLSSEGNGVFNTLYALAVLLPGIAVAVRRVHDVDKSGWYILIPFYNLILMCTDGTPGINRFGSNPKMRS